MGGAIEPLRVYVCDLGGSRFVTHDFASVGAVHRGRATGGASAEEATAPAFQGRPWRIAQQGSEGLEVKPEDGEERPVRYADGGRVGLLGSGLGALVRLA